MIGKTETIRDSLDPEWVKSFDVPYRFEEMQVFKVVVYHVDDVVNAEDLEKQNVVGEVEFTLHEVVTALDQILKKNISESKDAFIEITGEE